MTAEEKLKEIIIKNGAADCGTVSWEGDGFAAAVFPYYTSEEKGNISLYARGPDYHKVVMKKLTSACDEAKREYPENQFEPSCDISPYNEVKLAAMAGLGVLGRNNLLITPGYGSWVFIGIIKTDMAFGTGKIKNCPGCGKCAEACPGGALTGTFDPEKCLSHITQTRKNLTEFQEELLKKSDFLWGCDICQTACPLNMEKKEAPLREFLEDRLRDLPDDCALLSDREFRKKYGDRAFSFRGNRPLKRNIKLNRGV